MGLDDGNKIVDVARLLGVGEGTLGNWVRQERIDRGERAELTMSEKTELAELGKENARLRMERDLLKRATAVWVKEVDVAPAGDPITRYCWVAAGKAEGFPITAACKAAQVSTTVFDDWRRMQTQGPTEAEVEEAALTEAIREIHDESDGTYREQRLIPGAAGRGVGGVNPKRVERLCGSTGSSAFTSRRRSARRSQLRTLRRCQTCLVAASTPINQMSAGLATSPCIPTGEGWLYLASVLDLGSRRLVRLFDGRPHCAPNSSLMPHHGCWCSSRRGESHVVV